MTTPPDAVGAAAPAPDVAAPADARCRNCGAGIGGAWCASCGQETNLALPSVGKFMREAAGRYVALDGRFWRTLFALLFRPGFLTLEYLEGRRRRYVRPARLVLVLTLALFALYRLTGGAPGTLVHEAGAPAAPTKAAPPARFGTQDATGEPAPGSPAKQREPRGAYGPGSGDNVVVSLGQSRLSDLVQPRIEQWNRLSRREKAERLYAGLLHYGAYALIALLPAFALLLKLLYPGQRGPPHRPHRYAEHLVFAAHCHGYLCLALMLAEIPHLPLRWVLLPWSLAYLPWALRVVYGGGGFGIALRAGVIAVSYAVLFGLALAGALLTAVLLR